MVIVIVMVEFTSQDHGHGHGPYDSYLQAYQIVKNYGHKPSSQVTSPGCRLLSQGMVTMHSQKSCQLSY